jgi:glycine/D-amino acid oxidase-like deaminating enzyme
VSTTALIHSTSSTPSSFVLATDGYTHGLLPELDAVVSPTRGQVVVTEPLARRLFPCPHYARYGYD